MLEKIFFINKGLLGLNLFLLSKYIIVYTVLSLSVVILILFIILKVRQATITNKFIFITLKNIILYFFLILLVLHMFKFFISLSTLKYYHQFSLNLLYTFENKYSFIFSSYHIGFADSIVLLAIITGIVCIFLLGDKHLNFSIINIIYFSFFLLVTIIIV
jgi:hypothetical protein